MKLFCTLYWSNQNSSGIDRKNTRRSTFPGDVFALSWQAICPAWEKSLLDEVNVAGMIKNSLARPWRSSNPFFIVRQTASAFELLILSTTGLFKYAVSWALVLFEKASTGLPFCALIAESTFPHRPDETDFSCATAATCCWFEVMFTVLLRYPTALLTASLSANNSFLNLGSSRVAAAWSFRFSSPARY